MTRPPYRPRVDAFESRTPASSLLDLGLLAWADGADQLTARSGSAPFADVRRVEWPAGGFDRPVPRPQPADAGKMADTQPLAAVEPPAAERRGDWLEIAPLFDQQPVFVRPLVVRPVAAPADDTAPALPGREVGASVAALSATAATSPTGPLSVPLSAPRPPEKGAPPRTDPEIVALPYTGYMTAPHPTGYVTDMKVQEVDFRDDILVEADPGRTRYPTQDGKPEWRDDNLDGVIVSKQAADGTPLEWSVPTAYVRNTHPVATAKFKVTSRGQGQGGENVVTIRGVWQGYGASGIPFPPRTVSAVDDIVTYPATATLTPLPDVVDGARRADITWQYESPGVAGWASAGYSGTDLYVTLAAPVAGVPVYHTLVSLSTRASWGATDAPTVVNKTYDQFKYRTIQAVLPAYSPPGSGSANDYGGEGKALHYYKNWRIENTKTDQLLQWGDGQCRSWTRFFSDSVRIHGDIPVETRRVSLRDPTVTGDTAFAVTLWNFTGHVTFPGDKHPYANATVAGVDPRQPDGFGGWMYKWHPDFAPDVEDLGGAPGQNVENPASLFSQHFIVAYDDGVSGRKLYDPSYGSGPFTSFADWENESVFALVRVANNGKGQDLYKFRPNLAGADLQEGAAP